ncbi:hypothetical protein ACOM2C_05070 [Pseudarthrobacter sp. So.54]
MPALKRSIFRKAAAAAALSVALGAGALTAAVPASAATCEPVFNWCPSSCAETTASCTAGKSTTYVNAGTVLRANKYGWPKGTKLEYRWFRNGEIFAGGYHDTHKAWEGKGDKYVVRVKGTYEGKISYRFGRTYIVR